jgi:hypothetical protein
MQLEIPLSVLHTSLLGFLQLLQRLLIPLLEFKCQTTPIPAVLESVAMVFVKLVSELPLVQSKDLALKIVGCLLSHALVAVVLEETVFLRLVSVNAMLVIKVGIAQSALLGL